MRLQQALSPHFNEEPDDYAFWPARWITTPEPDTDNYVVAYRLILKLDAPLKARVHVTADQRYRFFVDGVLEGEGSERGDLHNWYYESYDLELEAGEHRLVALVSTLDYAAGIMPAAQITMRHGFLLAADAPNTELISTGVADWECLQLDGVSFSPNGLHGAGKASGGVVEIDGALYPWGVEKGRSRGWQSALHAERACYRLSSRTWGLLLSPLLRPGTLPPQVSDKRTFSHIRYTAPQNFPRDPLCVDQDVALADEAENIRKAWAAGHTARIEPNQRVWLLLDLEDYYCGYPELTIESGAGSTVRVLWAESLYSDFEGDGIKGNRDEIIDKYFHGRGDTFKVAACPEPRLFTSFWWSCGRYVAIVIDTADEPLLLRPLTVRETRFPHELRSEITLENAAFEASKDIMWRSLEMCSHETYMDCPYYEQLNYAGDSRVQALVTYMLTGDDRLAKKCIELFGSSTSSRGLTLASYPSSTPQVIPQFSLYWIAMLYDVALWRGDKPFVQRYLPRIRFIIDEFLSHVGEDGLLRCPDGWNWVDWSWVKKRKVNSSTIDAVASVNHIQLIYVMGLAAELERWAGRTSQAEMFEEERRKLWNIAIDAYWDDRVGLFASAPDHDLFGEHAQCFAVLTGLMSNYQKDRMRRALVEVREMDRATFYFQFYLFEAYNQLGLHHQIITGLEPWAVMAESGLRTTLEREDPSRSDCHAWSTHPLFHAATSIVGIRPASMGFSSVHIRPAVDSVPSASIKMVHQAGYIRVSWRDGELSVELPSGLEGKLELYGEVIDLKPGAQTFVLSEFMAVGDA